MSRTQRATEARMNAVDLRIAERLRRRGWVLVAPEQRREHVRRAHLGKICLDCPVVAGGHDV